MTAKTDFSVIKKTYTASIKKYVVFIVTYDLPVHWAFRLHSHDDHIRVSLKGQDSSVDLKKTKSSVTVTGRDAAGNEKFTTSMKLDALKDNEINHKFNNNGAVNYTIKFRMEIPVACKEDLAIDFKSPDIAHDKVLILQGEKFYINSSLLSIYSNYFVTLFNGNFAEKDKKEISIEEVDPNEFEELLKVIYPTRKDIDASNVLYLWKLADRFDIPSVIHMCEQYMTASPGYYMFTLEEKFDLLLSLKSEKLEKKCRELMKKMSSEA